MQASPLLILLLSALSLPAQDQYQIRGKSLVELQRESSFDLHSLRPRLSPNAPALFPKSTKRSMLLNSSPQAYTAPQVYRYEDLAFFCRLEVRMEKASRIPVKFRLGEVQYTEQMEGKY